MSGPQQQVLVVGPSWVGDMVVSQSLYRVLQQAGAQPAGLFAQTSMRIEKRFLAYGHDLDTDINPLQAGLGFTLHWDSDFIGRAALLAQRDSAPKSRVVSLVLQQRDAVPLGNEPVLLNGEIVGKTTSAAFGYRIDRPVALAIVDNDAIAESTTVQIDIARQRYAARLIDGPAYQP